MKINKHAEKRALKLETFINEQLTILNQDTKYGYAYVDTESWSPLTYIDAKINLYALSLSILEWCDKHK